MGKLDFTSSTGNLCWKHTFRNEIAVFCIRYTPIKLLSPNSSIITTPIPMSWTKCIGQLFIFGEPKCSTEWWNCKGGAWARNHFAAIIDTVQFYVTWYTQLLLTPTAPAWLEIWWRQCQFQGWHRVNIAQSFFELSTTSTFGNQVSIFPFWAQGGFS
jgi:hypothetical protein